MLKLITDSAHYTEVLARVPKVKRSLWIGTADIKDLYVKVGSHQVAYIGSANLTGAGIGMKGDGTRNFEAGILTDNPELVEQALNQFDEVWIGKHCKACKRKEFCGDPIAL